jgi:hypothetical protein
VTQMRGGDAPISCMLRCYGEPPGGAQTSAIAPGGNVWWRLARALASSGQHRYAACA